MPAPADEPEEVWCPIYKWGQSSAKVYVTVFVPCLRDDAVKISLGDASVDFRAERVATFAGGKTQQRSYRLKLELRETIDADRSAHFLRHDHIRLELAKSAPGAWRTLQAAHVPRNPNERPDFDHMESDDDDDDDDVAGGSSTTRARPRLRDSSPGLLDRLTAAWRQAERSLPSAWELLPLLVATAYVVACPYTKVEESFNLQAIHDFIYHAADLSAYDHFEFPGVVPRTCLGALAVAVPAAHVVWPLAAFGLLPKLGALYLVRLTLAAASCAALVCVQRATARNFGASAAQAFALLSATQFHWLFYCSRTLPNTFGGLLSTLAVARWVDGDGAAALRLLTVAAVIFRAELIMLIAPLALVLLATRKISLAHTVVIGVATGVPSLLATVAADSIFWRRPLWPEGEVLYGNTVLDMSANYGASPWHWYFSSALPRALLLAAPLALGALVAMPKARAYALVPLIFVATYSILPHKELRFILYAVPPLNVAAAATLAGLRTRLAGKSSAARRARACAHALLALCLGVAALVSSCLLGAARLNYPGAHALLALHRGVGVHVSRGLRVHVGVDAAMSGVSRFLELPPPWRYSKAEGLSEHEYRRFSHLLTAEPAVPGFSVVHTEPGFAGVSASALSSAISSRSAPQIFKTEPKIRVMRRKAEPTARDDARDDFAL